MGVRGSSHHIYFLFLVGTRLDQAHFEREQLLTLTLDEYHDDTQATLSRVFQHIGADQPGAADWASILQREGKINQQGQRYKKLAMLDETRAALRAFYGQCNARLSDLLDDKRWVGGGGQGEFGVRL